MSPLLILTMIYRTYGRDTGLVINKVYAWLDSLGYVMACKAAQERSRKAAVAVDRLF